MKFLFITFSFVLCGVLALARREGSESSKDALVLSISKNDDEPELAPQIKVHDETPGRKRSVNPERKKKCARALAGQDPCVAVQKAITDLDARSKQIEDELASNRKEKEEAKSVSKKAHDAARQKELRDEEAMVRQELANAKKQYNNLRCEMPFGRRDSGASVQSIYLAIVLSIVLSLVM
eukprot:Filipodium_phascolosomae@DN7995_c0_g1_i1.p1